MKKDHPTFQRLQNFLSHNIKIQFFLVGRPEPRPTWNHRNFYECYFLESLFVLNLFLMFLTQKGLFFYPFSKKYTRVSQITGRHYKESNLINNFFKYNKYWRMFTKFFGVNLNPSVFNHKRIRRFEN